MFGETRLFLEVPRLGNISVFDSFALADEECTDQFDEQAEVLVNCTKSDARSDELTLGPSGSHKNNYGRRDHFKIEGSREFQSSYNIPRQPAHGLKSRSPGKLMERAARARKMFKKGSDESVAFLPREDSRERAAREWVQVHNFETPTYNRATTRKESLLSEEEEKPMQRG